MDKTLFKERNFIRFFNDEFIYEDEKSQVLVQPVLQTLINAKPPLQNSPRAA